MKLSDEQNIAFMRDPRRIEAEKELHTLVSHIQADIKADGNAEYYLTVLPPIMKKLEVAYENFIAIEALLYAEIAGQTRFHS